MSQTDQSVQDLTDLRRQIEALEWYHTVDLGNGIVTPGKFDHRPYLQYYGIPDDLRGKTALDVGAASGFFSFELEQRGAQVTAVDLPAWFDHDFGPCYEPDKSAEEGLRYLRDPLMLAKKVLGSKIRKIEMTIYDISPKTIGTYDLVFCGSLLLHLTDPVRALWQLQRVTSGTAIIATVIASGPNSGEPVARFVGHQRGDGWWLPSRACLEAMVEGAGFSGWEWYSDFRLDYRDGQPGPYHGVIRAWNTPVGPELPAVKQIHVGGTQRPGAQTEVSEALAERDAEIAHLRELVAGYEKGRFIRFMRWLHNLRPRRTDG